MQYSIIGDASQCVVTQMTLGDEIRAEVATLVLVSDGIALEAAANTSVMRVSVLPVQNAPIPLTTFRCSSSTGVVGFAAPFSGEVRELPLKGATWYCARESFLLTSRDVTTVIGFAEAIETGYFKEGGFILYHLAGYGEAYIQCGGNVIEYDLTHGQRVTADLGCVAAFQDTVTFNLERFADIPTSQGGTDTLYLMTLTGPGRIYLATLPLARMSQAVRHERPVMMRPPAHTAPDSLGNLIREL